MDGDRARSRQLGYMGPALLFAGAALLFAGAALIFEQAEPVHYLGLERQLSKQQLRCSLDPSHAVSLDRGTCGVHLLEIRAHAPYLRNCLCETMFQDTFVMCLNICVGASCYLSGKGVVRKLLHSISRNRQKSR